MKRLTQWASCFAIVVALLLGISGVLVCFSIVAQISRLLAVVGLLLFPVMLAVAPWYALLHDGAAWPLIFVYGGGMLAGLLLAAADRLGSRRAVKPL